MPAILSLPTAESILHSLNDTELSLCVRDSGAFQAYRAQYCYVSSLKWNPPAFDAELAMLELMYKDLSIEIACFEADL